MPSYAQVYDNDAVSADERENLYVTDDESSHSSGSTLHWGPPVVTYNADMDDSEADYSKDELYQELVDRGRGIATLNAEVKDMAEEITELQELLRQAQAHIHETADTHKEAVAQMRAEHEQVVAQMRAEQAQAVAQLKAEHEQIITQLKAEHTTTLATALAAKETEHADVLNALKTKHEAAFSALTAQALRRHLYSSK